MKKTLRKNALKQQKRIKKTSSTISNKYKILSTIICFIINNSDIILDNISNIIFVIQLKLFLQNQNRLLYYVLLELASESPHFIGLFNILLVFRFL